MPSSPQGEFAERDQLAAKTAKCVVEVGEGFGEECVAVRGRKPGSVDGWIQDEQRHDAFRARAGHSERGVVVHAQVTGEQDDSGTARRCRQASSGIAPVALPIPQLVPATRASCPASASSRGAAPGRGGYSRAGSAHRDARARRTRHYAKPPPRCWP